MEAAPVESVARPRRARYGRRLRRSWFPSAGAAVWMLLGLMPLLFFQTAVHEGSHCVAMAASGAGCQVWAPFPVTLSIGPLHGVTFARVEDAEVSILAVIAPQLVAAALIPGLLLVGLRVRDERWALLTRLWLLGACIDLLNNTFWRPHGRFGDWSVMASELGLSPGVVFASSLPFWLTALAGLLLPLSSESPRRRSSVRDLSEVGLAYALVSTVAAIVSLAVRVPDIDPESLWHRVPILLHAVTVVVCLAIFAASRRTRREIA